MSGERKIRKVIIHCSDSDFGDVAIIRSWHTMLPPKGRGWKDIGYHWVIRNGKTDSKMPFNPGFDGLMERGRPEDQIGAHCEGHNADSLGVCLIGVKTFTEKQMEALYVFLLHYLPLKGLQASDVYGHYEFDEHGKTCPNFDMVPVRAELARRLAKEEA